MTVAEQVRRLRCQADADDRLAAHLRGAVEDHERDAAAARREADAIERALADGGEQL